MGLLQPTGRLIRTWASPVMPIADSVLETGCRARTDQGPVRRSPSFGSGDRQSTPGSGVRDGTPLPLFMRTKSMKPPNKAIARERSKRAIIRGLLAGLSLSKSLKGTGITYSSIRYWREKDPRFDKRVTQLLDSAAHVARISHRSEEADTIVDVEKEGGWRKAFARLVQDGKKRTEALDILGLDAVKVRDAIATEEDFRGMLENIEIRNIWDVEDNAVERAKVSTADARLVLTSALREKYGDAKPDPKAKKIKGSLYTQAGLDDADKWLDDVAHKPRGVVN